MTVNALRIESRCTRDARDLIAEALRLHLDDCTAPKDCGQRRRLEAARDAIDACLAHQDPDAAELDLRSMTMEELKAFIDAAVQLAMSGKKRGGSR